MNTFIPTGKELLILSKTELKIYTMFRVGGMKKEDICSELGITAETFRCHWSRIQNKLMRQRLIAENPQYEIAKGDDMFSGQLTTNEEGENNSAHDGKHEPAAQGGKSHGRVQKGDSSVVRRRKSHKQRSGSRNRNARGRH